MRLQFGECVFDSGTRELLRRGKAVHISPKAFRLLELLLECRPQALSKAELQERIWPETFVSEANLANLAAEVRNAIGEKARESRPLRTVFGYGYAFSGEAVSQETLRPSGGRPRCRVLHGGRKIPLFDGVNVIGRDPDAAVWIDDTTVSRHHARIVVGEKEARLEDLESKNGTFVEGQRVAKAIRISDGDEIKVGSVFLTFRAPAELSTETVVEKVPPDGGRPPAEPKRGRARREPGGGA